MHLAMDYLNSAKDAVNDAKDAANNAAEAAQDVLDDVDLLTPLKQEMLEKLRELMSKTDGLLECIVAIQDTMNTYSSCLSIKQIFQCVKQFTIDDKIKELVPIYDTFKQSTNQIEEKYENVMLKPFLSQIPEVTDFMELLQSIRASCEKIIGENVDPEDLVHALGAVHKVLSSTIKPVFEDIEKRLS
eukprot:232139_1